MKNTSGISTEEFDRLDGLVQEWLPLPDVAEQAVEVGGGGSGPVLPPRFVPPVTPDGPVGMAAGVVADAPQHVIVRRRGPKVEAHQCEPGGGDVDDRTGLVGRELLQLLLDDDDTMRVVVIARRPTGVRHPKLEERVFDLAEMDRHAEAFAVDNIFCTLGTTIKVPTQEGEREIELPSGTQHGTQYMIRGHGLPGSNGGGPGDMVVVVHVLIPSDLSDEQAELTRKLGETLEERNFRGSRGDGDEAGFFSRMRRAFG